MTQTSALRSALGVAQPGEHPRTALMPRDSRGGGCTLGTVMMRLRSGASGRDDQLPGCAPGFHRGVRLDDLIEAVDAVNRYDGVAVGDGIQELLQNRPG